MAKIIATFTLRKEQDTEGIEEVHNGCGFNKIEVITFNYDGKGGALVLEDGELSYYNKDEIFSIMFHGWYDLIK